MHKATAIIDKFLTEKNLKHTTSDIGELSVIEVGFGGKNYTCKINIISADDDNDAKLMSAPITRYPETKKEIGYETINGLNRKYKFVKFVIDPDGDLTAQYDIPVSVTDDCLSDVVVEALIRMSHIIDEIYPEVMRSIWGA